MNILFTISSDIPINERIYCTRELFAKNKNLYSYLHSKDKVYNHF